MLSQSVLQKSSQQRQLVAITESSARRRVCFSCWLNNNKVPTAKVKSPECLDFGHYLRVLGSLWNKGKV
jgi:hypothetical protein